MRLLIIAAAVFVTGSFGTASADESTCYGTVSNGRLEGGVKLPERGTNFIAYSTLGRALGRTYVHSRVADIVVAAYRKLERSTPEKIFVYGESGWAAGGRFRPHRTHRNGLSVDFMVPITDTSGHSVPLPAGIGNKFGYNIEFDARANYESYSIDFEAIAEHLYQLDITAKEHRSAVARVIFEPSYLPRLFKTIRGAYLRKHLNFMKGKAWIRHDEHYHVDFSVPCKPFGS